MRNIWYHKKDSLHNIGVELVIDNDVLRLAVLNMEFNS